MMYAQHHVKRAELEHRQQIANASYTVLSLYDVYCVCVVQLFHFDVHEDVRTSADARIEKDEVRLFSLPLLTLLCYMCELHRVQILCSQFLAGSYPVSWLTVLERLPLLQRLILQRRQDPV